MRSACTPEQIREAIEEAPKLTEQGYTVRDGCLYRVKSENGKEVNEYLLNGWIELISETVYDNGIDQTRQLNVIFRHSSNMGIPARIPFKDIYSGNFLVYFGADARPAVGQQKKAYITDSILAQAPKAIRNTVFQQTGFRKINGHYVFCHAGGTIGADNISVDLTGRNANYVFPDGDSPGKWDAVLKFIEVAPRSITYPLLAIAFLSPLNEALRRVGCEPSFVMWLQGVTGSLKSTMAALALNFYGEGWNNKNLPLSFKDTANFVEKNGFLLADVLTVCDDFYPASNKTEASRMATTAQLISRSWGDRTGRSRMNSDTSLKAGYPARGNLICTGEDAPHIGQSGAARSIVVELKRGDVNLVILSEIQSNAVHLSEVMRDFIDWLIPIMDKLPMQLKSRFIELRAQSQGKGHGRTAEAIAHLQIGLEAFGSFMLDSGQITSDERDKMQIESWRVLTDLSQEQNRRISQDKPTTLFLSALKELLDVKECNLEPLKTTNPYAGTPDNCLGYYDDDYYYLYPESAYRAVWKFYDQADRRFPLSKGQLCRHLLIEGFVDADEDRTTKLKKIKGETKRLLWLKKSALQTDNL